MSYQFDECINLEISTDTLQASLLEGLKAWLNLELTAEGHFTLQIIIPEGDRDAIRLDITTTLREPDLLEGLTAWLHLGLLDNACLHLKAKIKTSHPALLPGLDRWLQLQLLSDAQVRQVCRGKLTCQLPARVGPTVAVAPTPAPVPPRRVQPSPKRAPPPRQPQPSSWLEQRLQALMAELSVLWLLLLGAFLVVASSGVLAASQWQKFPPAGQYAVLWFYTLGFAGASAWTSQRPHLRLTAQSLRLITLLLVPVNFLAMDSFALWHHPLEWLVVAIASLSLSLLTAWLLAGIAQTSHSFAVSPALLNYLALSYLHWGWAISGFPLLATYLGSAGTVVANLVCPPELDPSFLGRFSLKNSLVMGALAILLVRAVFIAQLDVTQLGLAVGIWGWMLAWGAPASLAQARWRGKIGGSLLVLGWLLSAATVPGQALVVSGLALLLFARRFRRSWQRFDLAALLAISFQALWLGWRSIPLPARQAAMALAAQISGAGETPWTFLSVTLFPYLVGVLVLTDWFACRNRRELANLSGWVALALGSTLTGLSLVNPLLRTLNLTASTLALGAMLQRQAARERELPSFPPLPASALAALTHGGGLLALAAAIHWQLPSLSLGTWAAILLTLMAAEFAFSLIPSTLSPFFSSLRPTAWNFALILSFFSYDLLMLNQSLAATDRPANSPAWGALWLFVPLTLTTIGTRIAWRRTQASWLSVAALGLAQLLTLPVPETRLIGLGAAAGVMLVNTYNLHHLAAAAIAVGFALGWAGELLRTGVLGLPPLSGRDWVLAGAIAIFLLWLLRHGLMRRPTPLAPLYGQAVDGWAIALGSLDLLFLLFCSQPPGIEVGIASVCLMVAATYRSWQAPRSPLALWLSLGILATAQIPAFELPATRLLALGTATGLSFVEVQLLRHQAAGAIAVGFALGWAGELLRTGVLGLPPLSGRDWVLAGAIAAAGLWGLRHGLIRQASALARIYARAVDGWAIALCLSVLFGLTLHSLAVYWHWLPASRASLLAAGLTVAAIAYRSWQQPNNWAIYGVGWSLELLAIEVLEVAGQSFLVLAIANTVLGLLMQILGDWWHRQAGRREALSSWNVLPLLYGALGSALRWGVFSSWTGLSSLGLVLIALGVGRRRPAFKPLLYLAIAGVSLAAYELLLYQVAGLSLEERLLAMAALATSIMYAYRLLAPWLAGYLHLTPRELKWAAHLHWLLGNSLLLGAANYPASPNPFVGLGAGLFLTRYAIWQGRNHPNQTVAESWVYVGLLEAAAMGIYAARSFQAQFLFPYLSPWSGAIAAIAAAILYLLPWAAWGWPVRPWRVGTLVLPLVGLGFALNQVNLPSVWIVAAFYAWLAWEQHQPRWTYLSLLLVNGAIARWLQGLALATPFTYASQVGFSVLYLTWIEPACQGERGKALRHALRLLGTGTICIAALILYSATGIIPGMISLLAIFAGLTLRVRAFLYMGTATFLIDAFYQLVILLYVYPLLKWIVGLLVGIAFIAIAASFENRRAHFSAMLHDWFTELQSWQ
jgi:hypothetical protein